MKLVDPGNEYEARAQTGDFALLIGGIGANPERARTVRDEIIRHVNAHDALVEALRPFAEAVDGNLEGVGGGTSVAISTTVQRLKDAQAALALAKGEVS